MHLDTNLVSCCELRRLTFAASARRINTFLREFFPAAGAILV
ncbi:MAG: hypothetical protein AB1611_03180 [bacterium]